MADEITESILDAGCGTGENALFFAKGGQKVTGIDFLEEPITRARRDCAYAPFGTNINKIKTMATRTILRVPREPRATIEDRKLRRKALRPITYRLCSHGSMAYVCEHSCFSFHLNPADNRS